MQKGYGIRGDSSMVYLLTEEGCGLTLLRPLKAERRRRVTEPKRSRLWLAADGMSTPKFAGLMHRVRDMQLGAIKGNDALDDPGPAETIRLIRDVGRSRGFGDGKFWDITETMKRRTAKLAGVGFEIMTVSGNSGVAGIKKAIEGVTDPETGKPRAMIYVVGVLTTLSDDDVRDMYNYPSKASDGSKETATARQQRKFFRMAKEAGAHGLICAVGDIPIAKEIGWTGKIASPGIRSPNGPVHDQVRTGTPAGALEADADDIIMGREIVDAEDPIKAILNVYDQIGYQL